MKKIGGFTLVELLVVIVVIALLTAIAVPVFQRAKQSAWRAVSTHSLQQMNTAGASYRADHDGEFWRYREDMADGTSWWFGFETTASKAKPEGQRSLDLSRGPLGPYAAAAGGVQSDPAFLQFSARYKPKFTNSTCGYGYNVLLGGGPLGTGQPPRATRFEHPADIVIFATCAQVNTFQAPATAKNPMIEEFYLLSSTETTVHFRFGGKALAAMLDGSVRELPMDPTTLDSRMPTAKIGRFAPLGNKLYLWE